MPFPKEQSKVPSDIGQITVSFSTLKDSTELATGTVEFEVLDAAGAVVGMQSHKALPHMTAAQKTALFNFISSIRTKAKAEAVGP